MQNRKQRVGEAEGGRRASRTRGNNEGIDNRTRCHIPTGLPAPEHCHWGTYNKVRPPLREQLHRRHTQNDKDFAKSKAIGALVLSCTAPCNGHRVHHWLEGGRLLLRTPVRMEKRSPYN